MNKHTILFLTANPLGTDRLALDQEARAIQVALERSGHRDKFELVTRWAAQPLDLLDELRKLKPTVVHFSGHGGSSGPREPRSHEAHRDVIDGGGSPDRNHQHGLFFQGPGGRPQLVSIAALKETFGAAGSSVKLVVLSACYSSVQAKSFLAHVDCVVAMGGSIRDDAARNFAIGFYGGLGECQSVFAAYRQGRAAISLEGLPDAGGPQLEARDGVDAEQLVLADVRRDGAIAANDGKSRSRIWTWRSSVESAEAGIMSVLALMETVAAGAVYIWVAWRYGTLHLTISACVAPFLLLRSQRSVSLALGWFHSLWNLRAGDDPTGRSRTLLSAGNDSKTTQSAWWLYFQCTLLPILVILSMMEVFLICVGPAIAFRVGATIIAALRRPLEHIQAIPHNWWRYISCVDSCHPLELLPGSYRQYGSQRWHSASPRKEFTGEKDLVNLVLTPGRTLIEQPFTVNRSIAEYVYYGVFASALLLPALFYRWSIKGSAFMYSPLIWIVQGSTARSVRIHLDDIRKLAYYRITRWFGIFLVLLLLAKIYVYYTWDEVAPSWHAIPGHFLIDAVVMPEAFPPWQVAAAINAILAWCLYIAADWLVAREYQCSYIHEKTVDVLLRWLSLLRGVLSVYTIFCCVYLAASLSGRFGLPLMGTRILPWQ